MNYKSDKISQATEWLASLWPRVHFSPKLVATIVLSIILITPLAFHIKSKSALEPIEIAFLGISRNGDYPRMHRAIADYYIKEMAQNSDRYRFSIDYLYLDDEHGTDAERVKKLYRQLIESNYDLVIDNTWEKHIRHAPRLIRKAQLPVIAMNADRGQTNFGDSAVFMNPADQAPDDLLAYATKILQPSSTAFIAEEDYWLTERYEELLTSDPSDDDDYIPIDGFDMTQLVANQSLTNTETKEIQESLKRWSRKAAKPAVLILNLHNDWGREVVKFVDRNICNVTILAPSFAIREAQEDEFGTDRQCDNRLILRTQPEDTVSKKVNRDARIMRKNAPSAFPDDYNEEFYVGRVLEVVEIIEMAIDYGNERAREENKATEDEPQDGEQKIGGAIQGDDEKAGDNNGSLDVTRNTFQDFFLTQLKGSSVPGQYDLYVFDEELRRIPEVSFVEFRNGVAASTPLQLNSDRLVIPTVFFGLDLIDISQLDPDKGTFRADFYYWLSLKSLTNHDQDAEVQAKTVRAPNGEQTDPPPPEIIKEGESAERPLGEYIHFRNLSQDLRRTTIEVSELSTYRLERISGEFTIDFDLSDYPLDQQELTMELELANPFDDVRVAFDYAGFKRGDSAVDRFDIPGWKVSDRYITVDNVISSALSSPSTFQFREAKKYKTLTVRIVAQRRIRSALISTALPLTTIGIAALSLLLIPSVSFKRVGDFYIGIFLSIITYSIAFAQLNPTTSVLTRADYLFYLTFVVVLLVFLRIIILNALGRVKDDYQVTGNGRWLVGLGTVLIYLCLVGLVFLGDLN